MFCRNLLLLRRLITLTRKLRDSNDMESWTARVFRSRMRKSTVTEQDAVLAKKGTR
jgi:hypothetical protein